jgi:hypothetical protein
VTDVNEDAAEDNSAASPRRAVAAVSIGADPAPANIRTELISGGNARKLILSPIRAGHRMYRELRANIRVSVNYSGRSAAATAEFGRQSPDSRAV